MILSKQFISRIVTKKKYASDWLVLFFFFFIVDADYETMRRHQEQLDDQSFSRWLKQARQGGEDIE